MHGVDYAIKRYVSTLKEIERLKESEFPYTHSSDALLELERVFQRELDALRKLTPAVTEMVRKNSCAQSLYALFLYTPILGLILRSTNARNAFEVYYPLLRLARTLLGDSAKLLLSSEWDYSPFTFLPDIELKDFILIGHPAQESSNALLFPLAGHELGHNVWEHDKCPAKYDSLVKKTVIKLIETTFWIEFNKVFPHVKKGTLESTLFASEWLPAQAWAMRQLEECYCDVMGLRLFAEAYLHAFAYLLAPSVPGERALFYPNMKDRISYLLIAAKQLGVVVPTGYSDLFDQEEDPTDPGRKILVAVADAACKAHLGDVIQDARTFAHLSKAPMRDVATVTEVVAQFELVIPTKGRVSITDIFNAGWICLHNESLWNNLPQIKQTEKHRILNDLILKSLEVTEFHERIETP